MAVQLGEQGLGQSLEVPVQVTVLPMHAVLPPVVLRAQHDSESVMLAQLPELMSEYVMKLYMVFPAADIASGLLRYEASQALPHLGSR